MRRRLFSNPAAWALFSVALAACDREGFRSGFEVLADAEFAPLDGRAVALVTNPTGRDRNLRSIMDVLAESPKVRLVAVFGPEHGARGAAQAGVAVRHGKDPRTGTVVYSLYGETRRPTPEMLGGVEVVLFDIQDIGVRTYTYLSTLVEVLHAAAGQGIEVWVLDRPVPIGGDKVEGPVLETGLESFVGPHTVALRHGLTAGEFARLVNEERGIGARLRVIPMRGYRRRLHYERTGLPWVAPSPNIPTVDSALVYAGTVLVEGTNLSEGRGTTRPFQLVGAPWVDGDRLARELERMGLPGVRFRSAHFRPSSSKYRGELCSGVEIHVRDRERFEPVRAAVALIGTAKRLHPERLSFRAGAFDRLAGTRRLREAIEQGIPHEDIVRGWAPAIAEYMKRRRRHLLYR